MQVSWAAEAVRRLPLPARLRQACARRGRAPELEVPDAAYRVQAGAQLRAVLVHRQARSRRPALCVRPVLCVLSRHRRQRPSCWAQKPKRLTSPGSQTQTPGSTGTKLLKYCACLQQNKKYLRSSPSRSPALHRLRSGCRGQPSAGCSKLVQGAEAWRAGGCLPWLTSLHRGSQQHLGI